MRVVCVSVLLVVILALAGPLQAHHSIPAFWDEQKSITVEGVVKRLKVVNPHSEIVVTVTKNGKQEDWIGVAGIASQMIKAGWTNDTLKVGAAIKIEGAPPRKEGAKGVLVRTITLGDGRVLTSGKID